MKQFPDVANSVLNALHIRPMDPMDPKRLQWIQWIQIVQILIPARTADPASIALLAPVVWDSALSPARLGRTAVWHQLIR